MKLGSRKTQAPASTTPAAIDANNYLDMARAFMIARGGSGFVIRATEGRNGSQATGETATEAQWLAWLDYFDSKKIKRVFLVDHGLGTVPAEWPKDFDPAAPISDRFARLPRRGKPIDLNRKDTAQIIRRATAGLRSHPEKRRDSWRMSPEEADAHIREVASAPISVSPALCSMLGLKPKDKAFD